MKYNYVTPTIEIIEIEIEDAVLSASGIEGSTGGFILGGGGLEGSSSGFTIGD